METMIQVKTAHKTDSQVLPYAPDYALQKLLANLPICQFDPSLDVEAIAAPLITKLSSLSAQDFSAEPIWRDTFALTDSLRTFYPAPSIIKAWSDTCSLRQATGFKVVPGSAKPVRLDEKIGWLEIILECQCRAAPATRCAGFLCLVLEAGSWKIWVLRTILEQLDGCGDVDYLSPKTNAVNGGSEIQATDQVLDAAEAMNKSHIIDCVIVGAGHAGLSCGGRLQTLGVNYIILEKGSQIGASWAKRYKSARLHTPRELNHLPFNRTFPDTCSEFPTKDELVEGFKRWAQEFGVDEYVLSGTTLEQGSWDSKKELWTLNVSKSGVPETITTRAVIMAIGSGAQIPIVPAFTGQAEFKGTLIHSANYWSAETWKGKAGVVIGSGNTAHDVAQDMVEAGLSSITMVQRSRTFVLPSENFAKVISKSYNADIETHVADRAAYSMPNAVTRLMSRKVLHTMADEEPERFDALERAGFRCERYGDMQWHLLERFGGQYGDVGCSKLIADGKVSPLKAIVGGASVKLTLSRSR